MSMRRSPAGLRRWLLLGLILVRLWAGSAFTPWALSSAPLMLVYDALFYAGFVLAGWWLIELGLIARQRSIPLHAAAPLGLALACVLSNAGLADTAIGLHIRLHFSRPALEQAVAERASREPIHLPDDDRRRRIGAFLVDTWRLPCRPDQPWLWLGRPFGAGTGINRALIRSQQAVPDSPDSASLRVLDLGHGWWLAYQNPNAWFRPGGPAYGHNGPCRPGSTLSRHREGLDFIADPSRDSHH